MIRELKAAVLLAGGFLLAVPPACAQTMGGGRAEIAGYGGLYHAPGTTKAAIGGDIGINANRFIHLFGEFNYVIIGTFSGSLIGQGFVASATGTAKQLDFGGGVHFTIPTKVAKVKPYALAVLGDAHSSTNGTTTTTSGGSSSTVSYNVTSDSFYAGFGGGVRLFIKERVGLRPEFRYLRHPDGRDNELFTVGVFYQFGKK